MVNKIILYKLFTILLVNLYFIPMQTVAQTKPQFGLNVNFQDNIFQKITSDTLNNYSEFFKAYNIKYLRYPGGSAVRYYFWNNLPLSAQARNLIAEYKPNKEVKDHDEIEIRASDFKKNPDLYANFLTFCKKNNITPILQLNTTLYTENNIIYQIEAFKRNQKVATLDKNRWKIIQKILIEQILYTKKYIDNIVWEIGNEDYAFYDATVYGLIVERMINILKDKDPNSKIIVELGNSHFGHDNRKKWNKELIIYLDEKNILSKIDYFAPHFYNKPSEELNTYTDIINKFHSTNALNYENEMNSFFPDNYKPKYFYTETAIFSKSYNNINYNTQLHAIGMLFYLMQFAMSNNLYGIIHHGFTQKPSALFFDKSILKDYPYMSKNKNSKELFAYIPPQAEVIKLYYQNVIGNLIVKKYNDKYLLLLWSDNKNYKLQVLNYSNTDITIDLNKIINCKKMQFNKIISYGFDQLNSHYWPIKENIYKINDMKNIKIKKFTFCIIN